MNDQFISAVENGDLESVKEYLENNTFSTKVLKKARSAIILRIKDLTDDEIGTEHESDCREIKELIESAL